jgi:hypothetical protein
VTATRFIDLSPFKRNPPEETNRTHVMRLWLAGVDAGKSTLRADPAQAGDGREKGRILSASRGNKTGYCYLIDYILKSK